MSVARVRKVVILGGGTAGWMTAAALSKAAQSNVAQSNAGARRLFDISLVESEEIGTIGVGEATIPTIHWFNQLIGLDEAEFMKTTQATYKLGIEFVDWLRPGHRYFHPFGRYGPPGDGVMFLHRWIRAHLAGRGGSFEDYSLATVAARLGRFALPSGDPKAWPSVLGYAFHFDASLYARFLRGLSERQGVTRVEGKVRAVERHPESGFVTALTTERGERLEGDLFVDCSGMRALLIGETLGVGYEDWSHWLPCDRALAVPSENVGPPHPFTRSTAEDAGWRWRIPLQHRTGNGYVYCSRLISDDEAASTLLARLEGRALADPRPIRFRAGRRLQAWSRNVVAIGLSSGFLEPLESTSIHMIQSGIAKLLALFPGGGFDPLVAEQFNRVFNQDVESIRDFLILHYHANPGRSQALWRACAAMPLPETLVYREDQFRRTGRLVLSTDELFRDASWFAVMMGQGVHPTDYNPLVDATPEADDLAYVLRVKQAIQAVAERLPTHGDFIRQHRAAPAATAA